MNRVFIGMVLMLTAAGPALAQTPPLRVSQYAEVKQRIGLADVSIVYHRPGVKGRVIWGDLQKYDEAWRAGANEPTLVTFSDTATVAGKRLAPGTYRFVVIPRASGPWTVAFNAEVKNWGTVYDSTFDVFRASIPADPAPNEEWMSFTFTDLTPSTASLVLRWEKVALKIPLEFNTSGRLAAIARAAQGQAWQALNNYARYLLDNGGSLADATKAADQALAIDENPGTLRTKAELQAKGGDYAGAVKTAEKAVQIGKSRNPNFNTTALDNFVKEWKGKAKK